MEFEQELFQQIGKLLWSIFPEDASTIEFKFQLFDDRRQSQISWNNDNGETGYPEAMPFDLIDEVFDLLIKLNDSDLFEREPFSHGIISVTNDSKISTKFKYIKKGDSWPGLYMQGVSELCRDEIKRYFIPEEEWKQRVDTFSEIA